MDCSVLFNDNILYFDFVKSFMVTLYPIPYAPLLKYFTVDNFA